MANAHHPHLRTHDWFERSRLVSSLSSHTVALSVVVFLAIVALLLALFEWLQILPEQVTMSAATYSSTKRPDQALWQVSQKNRPDPFLEQKKTAANADFPDQF